jgi:ABC-type glutathione transport system ATPase component
LPLLEISGLSVEFEASRRSDKRTIAVADLDLSIAAGTTVALVGESGSGKTTLARSIVRLIEPSGGSIRFDGNEMTGRKAGELVEPRSRIGLVMQDSASALNPRRRVLSSVASPLALRPDMDRRERARLAGLALERVGLPAAFGERRPDQLSGGQRQRVCIARAIVTDPKLLICDEPLAGLDLVTESLMLEVLKDAATSTACLFITHDLCLAAAIGDRVAVMENGRIVEDGPAGEILSRPAHPHTRALVEAIPPAGPDPAWRERHGIAGLAQPPFEAAT